jgi:hypothetical protein
MTMKKIILAALTGTALLAAAPAFADNSRGGRHDFRSDHRGNHFQGRPVVVHRPAYGHGYGYRPAIVHRPAYGYYAPRHDLLGSLILGTVIGAAIANQY